MVKSHLLSVSVVMLLQAASAMTHLTWNGALGVKWDATSVNWIDELSQPSVWIEGAVATFPAGAVVGVDGTFKVSGLVLGDGVVLGGRGTLLATGDIDVASDAVASLALPVWADGAVRKTGAGDLGANMFYGAITITGGRLISGGRDSERSSETEAGGARLWVVGDVTSPNLVGNGSFEEGTPQFNSYYNFKFVSGDAMPTGWETKSSHFAWMKQGGSSYLGNNGTGTMNSIPDGALMSGIRYDGSFRRQVTVETDGFYELSFICFKRRRGDPFMESPYLEVQVDGLRRYFQHVFWRTGNPVAWQDVASGPLWLTAGTHEIAFAVEGSYGDRMAQIDKVRLQACVPGSAPSKGDFEKFIPDDTPSAASPSLSDNMFCYLYLTKTGPGKSVMPNQLTVPRNGYLGAVMDLPANLTVTTAGELEMTGLLKSANAATGVLVNKRGPGVFSVRGGVSTIRGFDVYEGQLNYSCSGDQTLRIDVDPSPGSTATFRAELADDAVIPAARAFGPGKAVIATSGSGHVLAITNAVLATVPELTFDVGAGDTLAVSALGQYRVAFQNEDNAYVTYRHDFETDVVKTGSGRLQVQGDPVADNGTRALAGGYLVKQGTLSFGTNVASQVTMNTLDLGGCLEVGFDGKDNDTFRVGELRFSPGACLAPRDKTTGAGYVTQGVYPLFTYDTQVGDPAAVGLDATAGIKGIRCSLVDDPDSKTVSLRISAVGFVVLFR